MRTVRAVYGGVLLVAPRAALRCAGTRAPHRAGTVVVRALGARHIAQAALAADGSLVGAGVDVVHAASMACLAAAGRGVRRPATASALVSGALAADALRRRA